MSSEPPIAQPAKAAFIACLDAVFGPTGSESGKRADPQEIEDVLRAHSKSCAERAAGRHKATKSFPQRHKEWNARRVAHGRSLPIAKRWRFELSLLLAWAERCACRFGSLIYGVGRKLGRLASRLESTIEQELLHKGRKP